MDKKILRLVLVILVIVSFTGCIGSEKSNNTTVSNSRDIPESIPEAAVDVEYNDGAAKVTVVEKADSVNVVISDNREDIVVLEEQNESYTIKESGFYNVTARRGETDAIIRRFEVR